MKIYRCTHCGNIAVLLHDAGVPLVCCGQKMEALIPGSVDAAQEKHVPAVTRTGSTVEVTVGSVEHPMLAEHWIEWILLETDRGYAVRRLSPGATPRASFLLGDGETPKTVYAYCNLHGLWKTEL